MDRWMSDREGGRRCFWIKWIHWLVSWEGKSCSQSEGQCYPVLYSALETWVQAAHEWERVLMFSCDGLIIPEFEKEFLKIHMKMYCIRDLQPLFAWACGVAWFLVYGSWQGWCSLAMHRLAPRRLCWFRPASPVFSRLFLITVSPWRALSDTV